MSTSLISSVKASGRCFFIAGVDLEITAIKIRFSVDIVSVWDSLAFQPWFTATAANVGCAYWSQASSILSFTPDGFSSVLSARSTHNTTKNPNSERRIWAYPEPYSAILRSTFQLRYALQPYIYTEARRTYDTGTAFLHPLYYDLSGIGGSLRK
jgi:alpha-glucosidase